MTEDNQVELDTDEAKEETLHLAEKPKEEKVQEQTSTMRSLIGKILMKTDNWTYEELSSMEEGSLKRKIQMLENG